MSILKTFNVDQQHRVAEPYQLVDAFAYRALIRQLFGNKTHIFLGWLTNKSIENTDYKVRIYPFACIIQDTLIYFGDATFSETPVLEYDLSEIASGKSEIYIGVKYNFDSSFSNQQPATIAFSDSQSDLDVLLGKFIVSDKSVEVNNYSYHHLFSIYKLNYNDLWNPSSYKLALCIPVDADEHTALTIHNAGNQKCHLFIDGDVFANEGKKQLAYTDLSNVSSSAVVNKIKGADGSGSGLDADKVDGLDADRFLRRDTSSAPTEDGKFDLGSSNKRFKTVYAGRFDGTASSADYADLAEYFIANEELEVGDVVSVSSSDDYEIEKSDVNSKNVLGVVSEKPAYIMNNKISNHPYAYPIALKGRVFAKVKGPVEKGDELTVVSKGILGKKKQVNDRVVAIALQSLNSDSVTLLEVVVV